MRIGVPLTDGRLSPHFGRSTGLLLAEVDDDVSTVAATRTVDLAAGDACRGLPARLAAEGVGVVLVAGIGAHARDRLAELGIQAVTGVGLPDAREALARYLAGTLVTDPDAVCAGHDHPRHGHGHHQGPQHRDDAHEPPHRPESPLSDSLPRPG